VAFRLGPEPGSAAASENEDVTFRRRRHRARNISRFRKKSLAKSRFPEILVNHAHPRILSRHGSPPAAYDHGPRRRSHRDWMRRWNPHWPTPPSRSGNAAAGTLFALAAAAALPLGGRDPAIINRPESRRRIQGIQRGLRDASGHLFADELAGNSGEPETRNTVSFPGL